MSVLGFVLVFEMVLLVFGSTFLNPVLNRDFPDPTVMQDTSNNFYVYATEAPPVKIQGAKSSDLVTWQYLGEMLPDKPKWAQKSNNWWAPDVQKHNNTYIMYFAATSDTTNAMCIGVAFSANPAGPFNATDSPVFCDKNFIAIDPKSFDDPVTGKIYLYWGSDGAPISVRELASDRTTFAPNSSPIPLLYPQNAPYQHLIEGAWLHQKNGWYYLFHSGENCCGPTASYAVMVARSKSLTGQFVRNPNNVVVLNNRWVAPGHNSIITDSAGQDWIYYHAIDKPQGNYNFRKLLMDKLLYDTQEWPYVTGGTPSTTPQTGPVLA